MTTNETEHKPKQELLCKSKNGIAVTYDPVHSHAATHLADTPQLKELVQEIVSGTDLNGELLATHIDMGRIVGTSDVVEVDESDEIVYGIRKNRDDDGLVPFVKTRQAQPSPFVSVYLVPQPDNTYELSSAWIGTYGDDEPFPGSVYANEKSADYWHHHAFVYGSQEIVEGTEALSSPW